jgi:hemoglobin/transferrin/lactoferrin receptor protein
LLFFVLSSRILSAQMVQIKDKSSLQVIEFVSINNAVSDKEGKIDLSKVSLNKSDKLYFFSKNGYFKDSLTYEQIQQSDFIIYLSEKSFQWNGIVVSASRFEEKANDVAQQIVVLEKKDIQFQNQSNTADLLQQNANVFIQKSQVGGGSISLRGFEANKVLMVVDGVRLNNAIYRGGHLQNVLSIDNNILEKTEILFGPGSVVYGSDALGGVVHFYTKEPKLAIGIKPEFKTMAYTRFSSASNEKTGHFDVNIGFKKIAFLSSVTYSDFGDLRIGKRSTKDYPSWGIRNFYVDRIQMKDSVFFNADSFKQIPSGYKQLDLMQKVLFSQGKHIKHILNLQHSTTSNVPRYDRLSELNSKGIPTQAEWYYGPQKRTMAAYHLRLDKKTFAFEKSNITAAFQDIQESRHNRSFGSLNLNNRYERVKVVTLNADFQKEFGSRTEVRYGGEYVYNKVLSTAYKMHIETGVKSKLDTRYPDGGSTMQSAAIYAMQNTYFSKRLILNTGIRFTNTYLKSNFDDKTYFPFLANSVKQNNQNTSGSIGLVYLGKKDLKISGVIASGFRAPNVDDMSKVFESADGRVIIPNRYLRPEKTINYDICVNKTFKQKLSIEINGYYTRFSDALTLGRTQLNGLDTITFEGKTALIYSTQNAQEAHIYGANAALNYDLNKTMAFNFKVNYSYGRIYTDSTPYPLDHIAPVFGRFGLIYKHKKWKAEFFALFNGAKRSADYNLMGEDNQRYSADPINGFSPAWITYNLRGYYQINAYLQLQCAIENIRDQHYRTFSSGSSAAGRNLMITLRGTF